MKRASLLGVLMLLAACGKTEPNEGKMMPKLAPPPEVTLPDGLSIEVEIDGQPAPAIDAAKLRTIPPDFADAERRAWKIATLVGPSAGPGALVHAVGAREVSVEMKARSDDGLVAVIMISRRGDVLAQLVDEKQPFPTFHGQGGRLGRPPGEPVPRVSGVSKLRVTSAPK